MQRHSTAVTVAGVASKAVHMQNERLVLAKTENPLFR